MYKLRRSSLMGLVALLIAALALTACSGGKTEPTTPVPADSGSGAQPPAPAQAAELNILMEAVPDTDYVVALGEKFTQETGIKVNFEVVNYAVMHEKLIPQLTSNAGSYDLIVVDNYWVGEFVGAGWLESLDPYIQRDGFDTKVYLPSMFNMVGQVDGTTYMLPFYNYAMALIYRKDVYEDPALKEKYKARFGKDLTFPATLEEYVELSKFITQESGLGINGTVQMGLRPDPISMEWLNYLYSMGGNIFDAQGNVMVNDATAVRALELYADNLQNASPDGAAGFGFDETFTTVSQGKAASYITFNWMLPKLNDPNESQVGGKMDIAAVPGGGSLNGGWGWAIPTSSPHKDDAWKFIKWVESPAVAKERALMGGAPTRYDVFGDADVLAKFPHYQKVETILEHATMLPILEQMPALIETLGRELSEAVTGSKSAKDALDAAAAEIKDLK